MPTYAYACTQCGHAFDAVQSFSDAALTICPECGGKLRKNYGSIGVTFSGSGFYRTDSRADTTSPSATSRAPSSADTGSATSSSTGGQASAAPAAS